MTIVSFNDLSNQKRVSPLENPSSKRTKLDRDHLVRNTSKKIHENQDFDSEIACIMERILNNKNMLGVRVELLRKWYRLRKLPLPKRLKLVEQSPKVIFPEKKDTLLHLAIRINDYKLVKILTQMIPYEPHRENVIGQSAYEVASCMASRYENSRIRDVMMTEEVDCKNLNFYSFESCLGFITYHEKQAIYIVEKDLRFADNNTLAHVLFSFTEGSEKINDELLNVFLSLKPDLTKKNDQNKTPVELAAVNFPYFVFFTLIDYMKRENQSFENLDLPIVKGYFEKVVTLQSDQAVPDDLSVSNILDYLSFKDQAAFAQTSQTAYHQVNKARRLYLFRYGIQCSEHFATRRIANLVSYLKEKVGLKYDNEINNVKLLIEKVDSMKPYQLKRVSKRHKINPGVCITLLEILAQKVE